MSEKDKKKKNLKTFSRREFLKDAGILAGASVSSAFFLTSCGEETEITKTVTTTAPGTTSIVTNTAPAGTATATQTATVSRFICPICEGEFDSLSALKTHVEEYHPGEGQVIIKSGYIKWSPDECAACSRCLMACAAYHNGAVAPQLSAIKWEENDYFYGFRFRKPLFCQQCTQPECYFACPLKDEALCIDETTGTRYINQDKCNGCGICVEACPFEVPRISIDMSVPIAERKAFKCDLCKDRNGEPVCVEVCNRQALTFVSNEGRI